MRGILTEDAGYFGRGCGVFRQRMQGILTEDYY
jgi:hypothetical protein